MNPTNKDESKKPELPAKRSWKPMELTKVGSFGDFMLGGLTMTTETGGGHSMS